MRYIFYYLQREKVIKGNKKLLGQVRPFAPCVSSLCSWRLGVRESMVAEACGQEAMPGQLSPGELQIAKHSESTGGWRTRLGKKQEPG